MKKYRVECLVVIEVEAGSLGDVPEAVKDYLWAATVLQINSAIEAPE